MFDEIVISLARMNDIISLDAESGMIFPISGVLILSSCGAGILVCQSGCILEALDDKLSEHGLMMPLDLGSKGRY